MKCSSLVYSLVSSAVSFSPTVLGQVVRLDIQKHHQAKELHSRADSTLQSNIANDRVQGGYFATVKIGTPGQELSLQLDTGSSDVWVPSNDAAICRDKAQGGCSLGSFNSGQSSTFTVVAANGFDISYQDNSTSKGDYFTDQFEIGSSSISNLTMGLGKKTDVPFGLIGVGYASNEASRETANVVYPNLPIAMQEGGIINSVAYSLWLNDLGANTGSILFGGIDVDKYVGNMIRVPVLPTNQQYVYFTVSMASLEATSPSGSDVLTSSELPLEVILDSGTTLSYLPQDMASQVWNEVGAAYDNSLQMAVIPCSYANHAGSFSFLFAGSDGPRINVTMDELVLSLSTGAQPRFSDGPHQGQTVCEFGIQNSSAAPYLLGDTFLRSAYVVYDLVNNEIGLAQTDFNSTKSNVVAFASKGAAIPSSTPVKTDSQSAPQPTKTGLSAAKGFQEGSLGCDLKPMLASTLVVVGMTIACLCIDSSVFMWW